MNRTKFLTKKVLILFFLLSHIVLSAFSQSIISKASERISNNLIVGQNEKAYDAARFIIKFYGSDEIPIEYKSNVQNAVKAYSEELVSKENWISLEQVAADLENSPQDIKDALNPALKNYANYKKAQEEERIKKLSEEQILIQQIKEAESTAAFVPEEKKTTSKTESKKEKTVTATKETPTYSQIVVQNNNTALERLLKQYEDSRKEEQERIQKQEMLRLEQEKKQQETTELLLTALKDTLNETKEVQAKNSSNNTLIVVILVIIFIVIFSVIILVVMLIIRSQKIQSQQLNATMETMQAMREISGSTQSLRLALGGPNGSSETNRFLLENFSDRSGGLTSEAQELQDLIDTCKNYGKKIDIATDRKDVSSRVADLTFKVSMEMGKTQIESMVNYASALVYDIGFLSIDTLILRSETLTKEQFDVLKTHSVTSVNMVFFVPEKYKETFKDAVTKHHENLDGSGYPMGLKDKEIPYIARLLRVIESYIALISRRSYRDSIESSQAFEELRNSRDQYDQEIVEALHRVINQLPSGL